MGTIAILLGINAVVLLFVLAELRRRRPQAPLPRTIPVVTPRPGVPCHNLHQILPDGMACPECGRIVGREHEPRHH